MTPEQEAEDLKEMAECSELSEAQSSRLKLTLDMRILRIDILAPYIDDLEEDDGVEAYNDVNDKITQMCEKWHEREVLRDGGNK